MNWRIRIVTNAKKLNNQNDLILETLYLIFSQKMDVELETKSCSLLNTP